MSQACIDCSTTNRQMARFCKQCGISLAAPESHELDDLIGMEDIKRVIEGLILVMAAIQNDGLRYSDRLHTVLMGNTGTGKTKLVNVLASLYHKYGVTKQDCPIIYDAVDFIDFNKNFQSNFKKAKGGILCIENVQKLIPVGYSQSVEQLDHLFREMSKQENRFDPIIVLSGQPQGLREFLDANDDVKSKFRFIFTIPDDNSAQLTQLTEVELHKYSFIMTDDVRTKLTRVFKFILKQNRMPDTKPDAKNAWLALKMAEDIKNNYYLRVTRGDSVKGERCISSDDVKGDIEMEKTIEQVLSEIDGFIGMHTIKKAARDLIDEVKVQQERTSFGISGVQANIGFHIVLTGNPGTGKTTIARKLGEIFNAIGVLELGHVIEVDRSKMVAQFVGQTATQVNDLCDKAMGGILFIDEAYTLKQGDNDNFGQEAIDTLLKRMEDDRGKFIVVIAGYPKEITAFLNSNPGLQSRFDQRYRFYLDDYTPDELFDIFKKIADQDKYDFDADAEAIARKYFVSICAQKDKNFGNGREARNLFEACRAKHSQRLVALQKTGGVDKTELTCFRAQDVTTENAERKDINTALKGIEGLVGLATVKKEIRNLVSFLQVEKLRAEQGGKETRLNLHFIFRGNPGTGKTSVARVVAEVFEAIGLLAKGHLIEVDRAGLVGQYVGKTAPQTNAVIDTAMGGVLFIDEAYTLATDNFGQEAIDTLLKRMEDDKGKFIVIAAGYHREMEDFLHSNSGLTSRFTKFIDFEDYRAEELVAIFQLMLNDKGMRLDQEAEQRLIVLMTNIYKNRDSNFANGRTARNIFENSLGKQSVRLGPLLATGEISMDALNTLTADDITK